MDVSIGKMATRNHIVLCCLILISVSVATADILNKNVERILDLSSQLVKETIKITAEETRGTSLREYQFLIPKSRREELAFLAVKDGSKKELKAVETEGGLYSIKFNSAAPSQVIEITAVYSNAIKPFPVEITQNEKQLVTFTGEIYFLSPYKTFTQTTLVKLSSPNILSYTQLKPFTITGNKIKYGPFENIKEHHEDLLTVHYENQSPFLKVTELERIIEVSHWGNIAVKEKIKIEHSGAKLKGSFSRYEFQKDSRSGLSAVKSYKTILPASAVDVYYRDTNGNISTSNMRALRDSVEIELRPRFPIFGGWKTQYTLGYNVPSFEYLYNSNDDYILKMRIIDHIFDDMVVDKAVIKVILPELTSDFKLSIPFHMDRHSDELYYTYLDTVGRPVISFSKSNLVENHINDFELRYKFKRIYLIQEPLLLTAFIFIIFIVTILYLRLDFSIASHQHKE